MNEKIKAFLDNLINLINNCNLPPSISYYILLSKTFEVKNIFDQQYFKEILNQEKEELKETEGIINNE